MAITTAINFTSVGLALSLLALQFRRACLFAQILVLPVTVTAFLALICHLYGATPLFLGTQFSTAIALHTAILFILLSFGIIYCHSDCWVMRVVSSESLGGRSVRRLFPAAILLPIAMGWLKIQGERSGLISNETGVSLVATGNAFFMSLYAFIFSFWLYKTDEQRFKTEEEMRENEAKYRRLFENSRDAIMVLEPPSWKFTSGNMATIEMFRVKDVAAFVSLGPWELSPERQPDGRLSSEKAKEMIDLAVRDGFCFFNWTHKRADGENFPATVLLSRIGLGPKMIVLATVRDITIENRIKEELRKKVEELERFNRFAVGRELRMIELKEKIKALEKEKGSA
jgi:PAS domain-containing protein